VEPAAGNDAEDKGYWVLVTYRGEDGGTGHRAVQVTDGARVNVYTETTAAEWKAVRK
jgi:hypothetical protein